MTCECKERDYNTGEQKIWFFLFVVALVLNIFADDLVKLRKEFVNLKKSHNYTLDYVSLLKEREYEANNKKTEEVKTDG